MLLVCMEMRTLLVITMSGLTFKFLCFDCFDKGDVFFTLCFDCLVRIHVVCEFGFYYL